MSTQRHIRELAIQALYQLDARGEADVEDVHRSITDAPAAADVKTAAIDLATRAWASHADADAAVALLAPDWPTHRQPPVDRSILRLAFYELTIGRTPTAIAINEAVELAKSYGSERSPAFINGILDKIARPADPADQATQVPAPLTPTEPPPLNPLATPLFDPSADHPPTIL